MTTPEGKIQRDIIQYLNGRGDTYVLNVGGGASTAKGTPDIIACCNGRFVALEVKRSDSSYGLTEPQRMRLTAIRLAGGTAEVVRSIGEAAIVMGWVKATT
jgi:Holliday junction resolvase